MTTIVALTVLQTLIDTLVKKNLLSEDDKKKIYLDSAAALKEIEPENPSQVQIVTDSIRYLSALIGDTEPSA